MKGPHSMNVNRTNWRRSLALLLSVLLPISADAWIILGYNDWDTVPAAGTGGWTDRDNAATVTDTSTDTPGNSTDWLQITFDAYDPFNPPDIDDVVYVDENAIYAGTWTDLMFIEFDFYSETYTPSIAELRFGTSDSTFYTDYYYSSFTVSETGWTTIRISLDASAWSAFGSPASYLTALGSIDWIGIYLYRSDYNEEIYGIDNFKLMIPEPGDFVMLGAAIAVGAWSFLRRRKESRSPDVTLAV